MTTEEVKRFYEAKLGAHLKGFPHCSCLDCCFEAVLEKPEELARAMGIKVAPEENREIGADAK